MARYKDYSYEQGKLILVHFKDQILPGSFEYAVNHVIDHELDLSLFESRYQNDEEGAPAYDPAILLKIILYAYSRGITSSRQIEQCCRTNIIFMALSADSRPHFTTIADFISSMDKEILSLFRNVLLICDAMGLIGKEMFAIDGCKMPSNSRSTAARMSKRLQGMERDASGLHEEEREDRESGLLHQGRSPSIKEKEERHLLKLRSKAQKINRWLRENKDKIGKNGNIKKSNLTDNESAKMATSHGVIQGYDRVVAADAKHQVIVHAEAFGEAQEHGLLKSMIEGVQGNFKVIGKQSHVLVKVVVTADSGFHSEANMKMLAEENIDGYIADNRFRKRDPRFATAHRRNRPIRKDRPSRRYFVPSDLKYDEERGKYLCPAGKELYLKNRNFWVRGLKGISYMAKITDCRVCHLRSRCLRNPNTRAHQVTFFNSKSEDVKESFTHKMIKKIDSVKGRFLYSRRMGIVEPVFGNITSTLGLNRFSLRGKIKVNIQWLLFCMVHNLGKIHRYGLELKMA